MSSISVKSFVQKISENHYVLPKDGDMKTDVHAYLSEALFQTSKEQMWRQDANSATYEGIVGIYLMPDCHGGYGVPIGSVIVTEDTLIQAASGYDISCGVICMKAELNAGSVKGKYERRRWIDEIEKRIPTGKGHHRLALMPKFEKSQINDILRYGAKSLNVDTSFCERDYIPVPDEIDLTRIERAYNTILNQLGSVGGSNHFIEMQCDRDTGEVYIMVHCGSRGYGFQTANHFFYRGAELRGLSEKRREESWLRIDEELGKEYWAYHNSAANFAIANRHIIVNSVREATQEVYGADVEVYYEISHNLIQEETLVLPDGSTKKGFVHRKGATRAFPAGHPDLVGTQWEQTGHPVLIPGSMFTGGAILFPQKEAYKSACSVNHGSGRILPRGEAKRKLAHKQQYIDEEMNTVQRTFNGVPIEGVLSNHRHVPLDECSKVYKDLDEVLSVLEAEGIAKIANRLYPIANIKGKD